MTSTGNSLTGPQLEERIAFLREFMLEERFANMVRVLDARTSYIALAAENMYHAQNASALVRHCEAFGIQDIYTAENLCPFSPSLNVVRGTDKWIDIHHCPSSEELVSTLRNDGYRIIATTPHRESCTPETLDLSRGPVAIVMGTEKTGVSHTVMDEADEYLRIPMHGMVESLNVSASAAIITYILSERMRRECTQWHLPDRRRMTLLYRWCRSAVHDADEMMERKFGTSLK